MKPIILKQHIAILECNVEDYRGQLTHLETLASHCRETGEPLAPAHAELLDGIRNLLAIAQRTVQRAKAVL